MTPPGDGLEFQATKYYAKGAWAYPGLDAAIRDALRNRPQAGKLVVGTWREWLFHFEGRDYAVFFSRHRNKIGLTAVFEASQHELIEANKAYLTEIYEKGGAR